MLEHNLYLLAYVVNISGIKTASLPLSLVSINHSLLVVITLAGYLSHVMDGCLSCGSFLLGASYESIKKNKQAQMLLPAPSTQLRAQRFQNYMPLKGQTCRKVVYGYMCADRCLQQHGSQHLPGNKLLILCKLPLNSGRTKLCYICLATPCTVTFSKQAGSVN